MTALTMWGWLQEASRVMPYGGPFSEALGVAGLSHYAAQLLYKCASDPVTQDAFGRPNLPPAAIAGVHLAPGAAAAAAAAAAAGDGCGGAAAGSGSCGAGGDQRIISYSSEPTGTSSSGLAKFPSEPFGRAPRSVYPTYSAFDLPPGEFHDVAWVRTATLCSPPCRLPHKHITERLRQHAAHRHTPCTLWSGFVSEAGADKG